MDGGFSPSQGRGGKNGAVACPSPQPRTRAALGRLGQLLFLIVKPCPGQGELRKSAVRKLRNSGGRDAGGVPLTGVGRLKAGRLLPGQDVVMMTKVKCVETAKKFNYIRAQTRA